MSSALNLITIPYKPLPNSARDAALDGIRSCGFAPSTILEDYAFSSTNKNQAINLRINALAFAHPKNLNLSNASITLFNAVDGQSNDTIIPLLAQSTAPFHLIHQDNQFSFLTCSIQDKKPKAVSIESHISYDQIGRVLNEYAVDLRPQRIIDVKQGRDKFSHPLFHAIGPLQLALWATDVNSVSLVKIFGSAVSQLRYAIETQHEPYGSVDSNSAKMKDTTTDIAIQLLGATILADTGVLGSHLRSEGAETPLDKLLTEASLQFPNYFILDIFKKYQKQAEVAYQRLRQIRYSGFLPEMLRGLYLEAYSKEDRQKSGSFDTPLYLTRHIWKHIPVEYLPPDQRVAVDITCGWGSFLIAGYERLSQLNDMKDLPLRDYLRGNDIYHFTARLAGLGLLLSTSEDHWNIDDQDALRWNWLDNHQPNIIVGNPPFRDPRTLYKDEQQPDEIEGGKSEAANQFLKRAVERLAPSGYLAMVMPRSFMVGDERSTQRLRKQLLENCDIQELLELPSGVFTGANPRAIVVLARKKPQPQKPTHYPVRVCSVQKGTLNKFQNVGTVTASGLVVDQSKWENTVRQNAHSQNTNIMEYKLLLPENEWEQIQTRCKNKKLEDYAYTFRGATLGTKKKAKQGSLSKEVLWLTDAGATLSRSFHVNYEEPPQTKLYPDDFERERPDDQQLFEGVKVLVAHATDTSWGKRTRVAIERRGYYVSGSYFVVVPSTTNTLWSSQKDIAITHEVLAAIIHWDVGNAWVIEHTTSLGIPKYALETLPFPENLTQDDCIALTEVVRHLEDNDSKALQTLELMDAILIRAYGLDKLTFERLRQITQWNSRTEIILDSLPDLEKANCFISGRVEEIDAQQNTIRMWIKGMEGIQKVQITASMPGWLLRPQTEFYTSLPHKYVEQEYIDFEAVDWGIFHPQMYTYMSEVELMEDFVISG